MFRRQVSTIETFAIESSSRVGSFAAHAFITFHEARGQRVAHPSMARVGAESYLIRSAPQSGYHVGDRLRFELTVLV